MSDTDGETLCLRSLLVSRQEGSVLTVQDATEAWSRLNKVTVKLDENLWPKTSSLKT